MRPKHSPDSGEIESSHQELCGELQRMGLAPAEAAPLARELVRLAAELPNREYQALLEGVVLGQQAGRSGTQAPELRRILDDFATELKKLDEGLRLLGAFLARLRDQTSHEIPDTLH